MGHLEPLGLDPLPAQAIEHAFDRANAFLQAPFQRGLFGALQGGLKVHFGNGQGLADFVMELAGDVAALALLDFDEAVGEDLQFEAGALAFAFPLFERLGHEIEAERELSEFIVSMAQAGPGGEVAARQPGAGLDERFDRLDHQHIAAHPAEQQRDSARQAKPGEILRGRAVGLGKKNLARNTQDGPGVAGDQLGGQQGKGINAFAAVGSRHLPRQRRAAMHEHAGHVAADHAHHQARQVLVAGADTEDAIPLVAAHRGFHAVGNQLARDERKAHARMRHGQPVAHRHHRAFVRRAAARVDAHLGVLRLVLQVEVAGAHLAPGMKHADVRARDVVVVLPQRVQEEVLARQKDMAAARLHPFAGPLADNTGRALLPRGQTLSDAQILQMNWLVDGVQTRLPH